MDGVEVPVPAPDDNADGVPDNYLHVDGEFRGQNDFDLNIATPQFEISDLFDVYGFLNDPRRVLNSLEDMFDGLSGTVNDNMEVLDNIPLIGDQLAGAGDFLDEIKTTLLGTPTGLDENGNSRYGDAVNGYTGSLGGILQELDDADQGTFDLSLIHI